MLRCMNAQSHKPTRLPVWHGSDTEAGDLLSAAQHHCMCVLDEHDVRVRMCPSHTMVFGDQRALDGLLFARHMRQRLQTEEFNVRQCELVR